MITENLVPTELLERSERIEKELPTKENIKDQTHIDIVSIQKYFPIIYDPKKTIICGTYVLYTNSLRRYIGHSSDIFYRIKQHLNSDKEMSDLFVVYIYETEDIRDGQNLESWMIKKYEPELNKIYSKYKEEDSHAIKIFKLNDIISLKFYKSNKRLFKDNGFEINDQVLMIIQENKITIVTNNDLGIGKIIDISEFFGITEQHTQK